MKRFSLFSLAALLLLAFALSGCGPSNTVRLVYKPADSSVLPAPGAPRVTVVQFADKRANVQLGVRRDNSSFVANAPVAEWVSRSLADELGRLGLQVSYATTVDQGRSGNPDYIVTGIIDEMWLKESSSTELSATIRASMILSGRKGRILSENLSAGQTRKALPSSNTAEELLSDTLQEVVVPAALKVQQAIVGNK